MAQAPGQMTQAAGQQGFPMQNQGQPPAYPGQVNQPMAPPQNIPQMMSPTKELNPVTYCRIGQETVQELIQKISELFNILHRFIQIPNNAINNQAHSMQLYQERKPKLEELMRHISMSFKRLHMIYNKVLEMGDQVEDVPINHLVPVVGEEIEESVVSSDMYYYASEEHAEVAQQLKAKNQQLKEIIDQMRTVIWEINTMITMRKT